LDHTKEECNVENAAFVVGKGRTMKMDLTEIEGEYEKEKIYSFLSTAWAIIADCDLNSEGLRWMGSARFTVWGVLKIICMKRYRGTVWYRGQKVRTKQEGEALKEGVSEIEENRYFSPELP
jgi:sphingosine kinase